MESLKIVQNFDPELYDLLDKETTRQVDTLSFIPDENCTSPICAKVIQSIPVNNVRGASIGASSDRLEKLVEQRLCEVFKAPCATVKTITIAAASRVVFSALTNRGDVVMSLDLRKKEHCNSENLAYRFVNFGIDPKSRELKLDDVERIAVENHPKLIIVSPVNYAKRINFERLAKIAKACGAYLWCDLSQTSGLTATGLMNNPMPYADVVTFSTNGAMQGPHASVILCKNEIIGDIRRVQALSGHNGLLASELAGLAARLKEMTSPDYKKYCEEVVKNSKAMAVGLENGGVKLVEPTHDSHLIMVDAKSCGISARGAQELLADAGIGVRIAQVYTCDQNVTFDSIRFSTLPCTARGMEPKQFEELGVVIAKYLIQPDDAMLKNLKDYVNSIAPKLDRVDPKFVQEELHSILPK